MEGASTNMEDNLKVVWQHLLTLLTWPFEMMYPVADLAGAGFYYNRKEKKLKCNYCHWEIENLPMDTDIFNVHYEASSECPLSKGIIQRQEVSPEIYELAKFTYEIQNEYKQSFIQQICEEESRISEEVQRDSQKRLHFREHGISSSTQSVANQRAICGGLVHFHQDRHVPDSLRGDSKPVPNSVDYRSLKPVGGTDMRFEEKRLKTFNNRWPTHSPVSAGDLAKGGFHFIGQPDRVQCVFCRGVLHSWSPGDIPMTEHRRAFATCPFVLDMDVGNIALDRQLNKKKAKVPVQDGQPNDDPYFVDFGCDIEVVRVSNSIFLHPEYADEEARRVSYKSWPKTEIITVDSLVKCGFFSNGMADSVTCFCCGVSLASWLRGEDPVTKHLHAQPSCRYISSASLVAFTGANLPPAATEMVAQSSAVNAVRYSFTANDVNARMDTWVVLRVVEMGYPVDLLRYLVEQQLIIRGEDFLSCDQLLDAACAAQSDMEAKGLNPNEVSRWIEMLESETKKREEMAKTIVPPPSVREIDVQRLNPEELGIQDLESFQNPNDNESQRRLNEELRVSQVCKICMDRPMKIVFLPCGHLVCCEYCAPAIHNCPMCRTSITMTVRYNANV